MTPRLIRLRRASLLLFLLLACTGSALAADWSDAARQLARKITAKSGPVAVAVTFKNASGLSQGEASDARRALELALRAGGVRFVPAEQAVAVLRITLAESATGYVWIAQLRRNGESGASAEDEVMMVGVPRAEAGAAPQAATSVSIRKQVVWFQEEQILDVALLDAASPTPRLLVLAPERVVLYRKNGGRWELEQQFPIAHARPWPRDLRGRLMPRKDHLLEAFLPGVMCGSTAKSPYALSCREGDDPWPLAVAEQPPQYAFYNAQRAFSRGRCAPALARRAQPRRSTPPPGCRARTTRSGFSPGWMARRA